MINLRNPFAGLGRNRGQWQKMFQGAARTGLFPPASHTHLQEVHGFGSNPGNLRMFSYLPPNLAAVPALVVVLHGCTQTAAGYDLGAGWSTLADRYGFALLLPEQQRPTIPTAASIGFSPSDTNARQGEAHSIRQMVEKMVVDHGIDRGACVCHRAFCRRGDDLGHAGLLSRMSSPAARLSRACPMAQRPMCSRLREHVSIPGALRARWGDLVRGASPHAALAARVGLARRRRHDGDPTERA